METKDLKLPPTLLPYWSYNEDSWTWNPKVVYDNQINNYGYSKVNDMNVTMNRDYNQFLQREKMVKNPLDNRRGGLSASTMDRIINYNYNVPDLKSQTEQNQQILKDYFMQVYKKHPNMFQKYHYTY